ncbi:hypothetical protein PVAP13_5KG303707 [Panicum virgatum]|uniref:Uncharacterized protein n=1 Tax=Panicum virgatum TaxID=38727 RepID=A0A8T0SI89_PANVG|nr:hypothetical protein PVAP13_5KG303707 [Panicum virgatum]
MSNPSSSSLHPPASSPHPTRAPPGQPRLAAPSPSLTGYTACPAPRRRRVNLSWRPRPPLPSTPPLGDSFRRHPRPFIPSAGTRAWRPSWSRRYLPLARVPRRGTAVALRQARGSASQERRFDGPSLLLHSSMAVMRPWLRVMLIIRPQYLGTAASPRARHQRCLTLFFLQGCLD